MKLTRADVKLNRTLISLEIFAMILTHTHIDFFLLLYTSLVLFLIRQIKTSKKNVRY